MGGLAESLWGIGQNASSLAYIKVGTGVGCGLILDGRVHEGVWGFAGELGHLLMKDDDGEPQSLNEMVGKNPLKHIMLGLVANWVVGPLVSEQKYLRRFLPSKEIRLPAQ